MNKKFIVITSINHPTEAVIEFSKWPGWTTIVVGDRKSPQNWDCDNVVYLSIDQQLELYPAFSKYIPENTYVRKMLGYLYAIEKGAIAIFESDDDNIPFDNAFEIVNSDIDGVLSTLPLLKSETGWANIYDYFGAPSCWPRGYPLSLLKSGHNYELIGATNDISPVVVQYLADEDPDVDAIYRMTIGGEVYFSKNRRCAMAPATFTPFNSQATLWTSSAFPLMFLPVGIKDRVTDILRGFIALSCLWKKNKTLAISSPIVYQIRNEHNLLSDFIAEQDLYINSDRWSNLFQSQEPSETLYDDYRNILNILVDEASIPAINIDAYDNFINHINSIK